MVEPEQVGDEHKGMAKPRRPILRLATVLGVLTMLTLAVGAGIYYWWWPARIGPAQPISFSHRVHVTDKKISCVFCHGGALDAPRAGVPPLETCMLCHKHIIVNHPEIRKLHAAYNAGTPVQWGKVNRMPDLAYFNHEPHLRKGIDCSRCHGNVAGMDRVALVQDFQMGFCVQCHRENNASIDCLTCHR